jgi:membrane-associated protease RseP (regulator of RpoE activity)
LTFGADGSSVDPIITIREAQTGPFILRQIPTCIVEDWKLAEPMSMGWPFFSSFDAIACLRRRILWLKDGSDRCHLPFRKDRSGLGGQRLSNSILIRHVAVNSPAWKAGLQPGGTVVAVDGRRIDPVYPPPGVHFGEKPSGTLLHLTLGDGRTVEIALTDYF